MGTAFCKRMPWLARARMLLDVCESDGESDGLLDKDFDAGDFAEAGCMALVLFWK